MNKLIKSIAVLAALTLAQGAMSQVIVTDFADGKMVLSTPEQNKTAKTVGGLTGAVIGGVLSRGSGGLAKTAAIVGMGIVGATVGNILTSNVADRNGHVAIQVGTDRDGQPVYETILTTPIRPGVKQLPQRITREVYDDAIARASAQTATPGATGKNGETYRALNSQMQTNLYKLMVNSVVARATAVQANQDLDEAELARSISPYDSVAVAEFTKANETYANAFRLYADAYKQVSQAIATAEKNGFDISAQKLLMAVVPGNTRIAPGAVISWPGVNSRFNMAQLADPLSQQ